MQFEDMRDVCFLTTNLKQRDRHSYTAYTTAPDANKFKLSIGQYSRCHKERTDTVDERMTESARKVSHLR